MIELPALMTRGSEPQTVPLPKLRQMLLSLRGAPVTLDCETNGVDYGLPGAAVRTVQVGNADAAVVLDANKTTHMLVAADVLDRASEIIAHSATADVSRLAAHMGRDAAPWWAKTTDTMVLAGLSPVEQVGERLGLEAVCAQVLESPYKPETAAARKQLFTRNGWLTNTTLDTPIERNGWAQVDPRDPVMLRYAAADVLDTAQLRNELTGGTMTEEVLYRERTLGAVLARVFERGILLDHERASVQAAHHRHEATEAAAGLLSEYGLENPGSNPEVAAVLAGLGSNDLPRTASGAVSVAKEALAETADADTPAGAFSRALLQYRHHTKLLSTYLDPMIRQTADGASGRAHPVIQQLGARATGRMSSRNPNIQNIPRPSEDAAHTDGGLRGLFIADPDMAFISADFSSVEVRLAAAASGDATLQRMLAEGLDLHGAVVEQVWGLHEGEPGFKDARYMAKRTVFGYLYGAGLPRLSQQLGEHADKAPEVLAALRSITPQLTQFNERLRAEVRTGRMRAWTHPSGRTAFFDASKPHKALNTIVQGWGREVLVDAILDWEQLHPGCTLWPIHDELVIQVPAEHAEAATRDLIRCMTRRTANGVHIVCEADAPTDRWGISRPFEQ